MSHNQWVRGTVGAHCRDLLLQCVEVGCSVLQCVAVMSHSQWIRGTLGAQCRVLLLQHVAVCCIVLQFVALMSHSQWIQGTVGAQCSPAVVVCCSVLQSCHTVNGSEALLVPSVESCCCSVLQYVAVCCNQVTHMNASSHTHECVKSHT